MIIVNETEHHTLSDILIEVLVCPKDQADLRLDGDELVCVRCGTRYPVEDGVPNMLIERE